MTSSLSRHPHLEYRALEQERDAFNRKYPPGSVLKLVPGRYGSNSEVKVTAPGAVIFMQWRVLINVELIANVFLKDIDFGSEGAP